MKNLLLLEWNKIKYPVLAVLFFCTVLSIYLCSTVYKNYSLEEQLEAWEVGTTVFNILFPLIAVIPTGWLLYYEKKNDFLSYTLPRASKKQYLFAKWIVMSSSAFTIVFTIFFVGALVTLFINDPIVVMYKKMDPLTEITFPSVELDHFLGSTFVHQPLLYATLLSFWKGILASLIATMGFLLSLFIQNLFIILTGPFVYLMVENYVLQVLNFRSYRFFLSFDPTMDSATDITSFSLVVGPVIVLLLMVLFFLYMRYVKKVTIYKV
ncbi:hypothetical protein ACFSFY_13610 [Sporosarcina siberiensis]|uniref:ABC-2 family transporter protein n=1 Tax=Sporosarcina siberiensis TaxID=1365606 RepID=A0ABW4SJA5_9BACL